LGGPFYRRSGSDSLAAQPATSDAHGANREAFMTKTYVRLAGVIVLAACVLAGCAGPHVDIDGKGLDDPYGTTHR
jgi:hypothetical protein